MGATQKANLAELADWVEGLRVAAHTARAQGNITLAEALDVTRFEVYEGGLPRRGVRSPTEPGSCTTMIIVAVAVMVTVCPISRHGTE